jgi:signal transduction histidine kinase
MTPTAIVTPPSPTEVLLHASQVRQQALLEHLPTGILSADARGVIRAVSGPFRRLLGCPAGGPGENLRHFAPLLMCGLGPRLADLTSRQAEFEAELRLRQDGGGAAGRLRARVIRDGAGQALEYLLLLEPAAGGMDDVERARMERLLQRSQRMESFGLLAAGIVHDLNNVLACILGAAELLECRIEEGHPAAPLVRQICDATQRGAQMTRKVLGLARLEEGEREAVDFNQVIRDVMVLLRRSVDPRIEIRMNLQPGLLTVCSDATTLHQLVMNLCVNARDAMPEGGELHVSTAWATAGEALGERPGPGECAVELGERAALAERPERLLVRVELRDTGTGIDSALLPRVFEPFFTTKDGSHGTGLGLAMVRKAVEELGGWLSLRSRPDWGTSVRLYFPWHEQTPGRMPGVAPAPREPITGRGRIMVVDDDEVVRTTMCDLIRTLGYDVEAMADGLEAVEAFLERPGVWDLILLDLMMPRMDGVETLRRIRAVRGDQPVLVVTGFAGQQNVQKLEQIAHVPLLMKPIQIRELSRHIAELVN